jgi:hypothetical protein
MRRLAETQISHAVSCHPKKAPIPAFFFSKLPDDEVDRVTASWVERLSPLWLAQLSQLRTFSGFFALIFIVKPSVFSVAL